MGAIRPRGLRPDVPPSAHKRAGAQEIHDKMRRAPGRVVLPRNDLDLGKGLAQVVQAVGGRVLQIHVEERMHVGGGDGAVSYTHLDVYKRQVQVVPR